MTIKSRLAYHLRCLREEITDLTMTALERLAPMRDRDSADAGGFC